MEDVDEILGRLTPEQKKELGKETHKILEEEFDKLKWADLEQVTDENERLFSLLKKLFEGPIGATVNMLIGPFKMELAAKCMIYVACAALGSTKVEEAIRKYGERAAPAKKPKRFEVDLNQLPKFN